jgi:hypothetical protein
MAPHANWKGFFAPFPRLLRYPYKVRNEDEYFDDIQDIKVTSISLSRDEIRDNCSR